MKIIFIKKHMLFGTRKMVVGSKANVMSKLGNDLIGMGVAQQHFGSMKVGSRKDKAKIKLSNLK